MRVAYFAVHGDARQHEGGIGHSGIDRHLVDMGDNHLVAWMGEMQCGVANQCNAVRHTGSVFGQPQRVADGVGWIQGEEAYVGIEALHMMYGT